MRGLRSQTLSAAGGLECRAAGGKLWACLRPGLGRAVTALRGSLCLKLLEASKWQTPCFSRNISEQISNCVAGDREYYQPVSHMFTAHLSDAVLCCTMNALHQGQGMGGLQAIPGPGDSDANKSTAGPSEADHCTWPVNGSYPKDPRQKKQFQPLQL